MKSRIGVMILLSLASSSVEAGRAPRHTAHWIIPANPSPPERVMRNRDGYFPVGTLVPATLYRLSNDVVLPSKNLVIIPAGTLMIPLADDRRSVCELSSRRGSNFSCLADTDNDGKLDTYFGTQVFNELFLGSIGDDGGFQRLPGPIDLVRLNPKTDTPRISLELKFNATVPGGMKYRVCTNVSWRSKYYHERSCLVRTEQTSLDASGWAVILGQRVRFDGVRFKPAYVTVDYNKHDVPFTTSWSFP